MVVLVAGALLLRARDDGSDPHGPVAPQELERQVQVAYEPLANALLALDRSVDQPAVRAALLRTERSAAAAHDDVLALADTPATDGSLQIYAGAAELYGLHASVAAAALDSSDAPLGGQLDALAGRVRMLADRVYDRGRIALVGVDADTEGVELDLVDEVPDFALEGLAAGPPLTPTSPADPESTGRSEDRATSRESTWRRTVADLRLPERAEVSAALGAADAPTLAALVERYVTAEHALRVAPDPEGGRERNNLLRLGLLVGADALRVAEGGLGDPGAALARVSGQLVQLGLRPAS